MTDPNYISQERARELINQHLDAPNGPYLDLLGRHTPQERARAVHEVDVLYQIANGTRSSATGYVNEFEEAKRQELRDIHGQGVLEDKSSANVVPEPPPVVREYNDISDGKDLSSKSGTFSYQGGLRVYDEPETPPAEKPGLRLVDEMKRLYGE